MARPTKLTPETQDKIVSAISAGNYYEAACGYAGISYSVFRDWMIAGQETKDGVRKKTKGNKVFLEFLDAVEQAEAEAEVRVVAQWQKNIPNSWQAARDFLARRHPTRWMNKEGREIEDSKLTIEIVKASDAKPDL